MSAKFLIQIQSDSSAEFNLVDPCIEAWLNQPYAGGGNCAYLEVPPPEALAVIHAQDKSIKVELTETVRVTATTAKNDRALALMTVCQFDSMPAVLAHLKENGQELTGHYCGLSY